MTAHASTSASHALSPAGLGRPAARLRKRRVLPGFRLSLGVTMFWLSLIVLLPLAALVWRSLALTWPDFLASVTAPRVLAAYRLTFCAALIAALVNLVFGLLIAWVLVRYRFVGRTIFDAMIDLPFALPTAVAGIALSALLAENGWIGAYLQPLGMTLAFNAGGVVIALIFIGLPFVVRTVQPVLQDMEQEWEEVSLCLGATHWQTFSRVIFPFLLPALMTGFTMAFARALGEYGSVIFIAGNVPMESEIVPLIIISKLEQYDVAGATAVATVMLLVSLMLLLLIHALQQWQRRRSGVAL